DTGGAEPWRISNRTSGRGKPGASEVGDGGEEGDESPIRTTCADWVVSVLTFEAQNRKSEKAESPFSDFGFRISEFPLFLLGRSGRKSVSLPALRATCYNPGVDCRVPCFRGCFAKNVTLQGRPRKHAGFAKLACFRGSFALDSRFGKHPPTHATP